MFIYLRQSLTERLRAPWHFCCISVFLSVGGEAKVACSHSDDWTGSALCKGINPLLTGFSGDEQQNVQSEYNLQLRPPQAETEKHKSTHRL